MGQAKARGTFEQRRAEAIARNKKRKEELRLLEIQKWESMTDEEKISLRKHKRYERNLIATLFGMAGLIGPYGSGSHGPDLFGPPKLKRHHLKRGE